MTQFKYKLGVASLFALLATGTLTNLVSAYPPDRISVPKQFAVTPKVTSVGSAPVAVKADLSEEFQLALASAAKEKDGGSTVRLRLRGLVPVPKNGAAYGVKVFVNSSETDPTPDADSPHYVGMVSSYGKSDKQDYVVDLMPTLRKLIANKVWTPSQPLVIRLVASPLNSKKLVENPKLEMDALLLEIP
jgi:hypothetical protein